MINVNTTTALSTGYCIILTVDVSAGERQMPRPEIILSFVSP